MAEDDGPTSDDDNRIHVNSNTNSSLTAGISERHRSGSLGNLGSSPLTSLPGVPKTIPRPSDALRRAKASAKASAKTATQRMRGMKKSNSKHLKQMGKSAKLSNASGLGVRNIQMCGYMYKRRSGMTGLAASILHQAESWTERKFGGRLWVLRYFVLHNGVIYYYDAPKRVREADAASEEFLDELNEDFTPEPGSERGSIDLLKYGVQLRVYYAHGSTDRSSSLHAGNAERSRSPGAYDGANQGDSDDGSGKLSYTTTAPSVSPPVVDGLMEFGAADSSQVDQPASPPLRRPRHTSGNSGKHLLAGSRSSTAESVPYTSSGQATVAGADDLGRMTPPLPNSISSNNSSANAHNIAGGVVAVSEPNSPSANDTKSPSPLQLEITYNNVRNPKEWQSWTLCAVDRRSLFQWIQALTAVVYVDRGLPNAIDDDSDDQESDLTECTTSDIPGVTDKSLLISPGPGDEEYYAGDDEDAFHSYEEHSLKSADEASSDGHDLLASAPRQLYRGSPEPVKESWIPQFLKTLLETLRGNQMDLAMALCISNLLLLSFYELRPVLAMFVLTLINLIIIRQIKDQSDNNASASGRFHEPHSHHHGRRENSIDSISSGSSSLIVPPGASRSSRRRSTLAGADSDNVRSATRRDSSSGDPSTSARGADSVKFSEPQDRISHHHHHHHHGKSHHHIGPNGKLIGGTTVPYASAEDIKSQNLEHVWSDCDGTFLKVRCGPNYKANKSKIETEPALFRTIGVDLFSSEKKIMGLLGRLNAPMDKCVPAEQLPKGFPRLLVFNFQLPLPSISSLVSSDGKGYNFAIYLTPTQDLINALATMQKGGEVEPAVRLLDRWFRTAEQDNVMKERLKLVGYILKSFESGLPGWTTSFNGKPVLIKKSGVIYRDSEVFEVDMDMRQWGILTRKGIGALLPSALEKMEFLVSFVIQGEEDDELPERITSATQFSFIDHKRAIPFPYQL